MHLLTLNMRVGSCTLMIAPDPTGTRDSGIYMETLATIETDYVKGPSGFSTHHPTLDDNIKRVRTEATDIGYRCQEARPAVIALVPASHTKVVLCQRQ